MPQIEHSALTEHNVIVQLLTKAFPHFQGLLVQMGALVPEIIGAHDGSVSTDAAAPEPALFEHGDIGDAVFLGKVVGGGQAMAASSDNNHIILCLRMRT